MAIRTAVGENFYIWHPQAGIQSNGTLYIVGHAERTLWPKMVILPAGTTMDFLCAPGQNVTANPIQDAFARGGAVPYGPPRTTFVDNYNLFKSPSNHPRSSGAVESYNTIGSIPDQEMVALTSDILTVRKRGKSLSAHSGFPFLHRGSDLKEVFDALRKAGYHYDHIIGYFCRGDPFREASSMSMQYNH